MLTIEIENMDIPERIMLVEEIWDSIAKENNNIPLRDEEKRTLDARLDALASNPDDTFSWQEIKQQIRA